MSSRLPGPLVKMFLRFITCSKNKICAAKLQVLRIQATFPIKHMKHLSKDTYFHMYNKKCHIVAFLHSEKAQNTYFLYFV